MSSYRVAVHVVPRRGLLDPQQIETLLVVVVPVPVPLP